MANNITPKLKAYVQIDATGRVVSGTPVFRSSKPKIGNWREIPMYYRGNSSTTTTTTAGGGGDTPTAFVRSYWLNGYDSCNSTTQGVILFYSSSTTLQAGIRIFQDAALTTPVEQGYIIMNEVSPMVYQRYLVDLFGQLSLVECPNNSLIEGIYIVGTNPTFTCEGMGTSMSVNVPDTGIATATYVIADFASNGFVADQAISVAYTVTGTNYSRQFLISSSNPNIANVINNSISC